jgi:4-hydroxybenzoate polyprenyltransferase
MLDAALIRTWKARLRDLGARAGRQIEQHGPALLAQTGRYARLMRLHRPIGIWLLLWPTLWALWIAADGKPDGRVFVVFVVGTILVRSAGCIINDFADRRVDPHVRRTADRPLATGEVTVPEALALFVGLMLIAFGMVLTINRLAAYLAIGGAVIAVVYPFTKRFFAAPQLVLGVAFAWGVPMAFAAELATVPRIGWLLFLSAVIWVVVYDTEYAMADREEDVRLGVRSTAILFGDMDRALLGALQASMLVGLGLVGQGAGLGRWFYAGLAIAAVLGLYQQYLIRNRDPASCLHAFLNNAWLGGAIFAGILLDYVFSG